MSSKNQGSALMLGLGGACVCAGLFILILTALIMALSPSSSLGAFQGVFVGCVFAFAGFAFMHDNWP